MIYRKKRDEESLAAYVSGTKGEFITAYGDKIEYYLTRLPELALLGKRDELEQEIEKGAPVLGLDMDILARLEAPMYLQENLDNMGWVQRMFYDVPGENQFYTTLDAAVCGGQYEVLKMLIERGAPFDLRCRRLREIYYQCRSEDILKLAFEKEEYHWDRLDYSEVLRRGCEANVKLMEMMYQRGIPLSEDEAERYRRTFYRGGHAKIKETETDPVMEFLADKCNFDFRQEEEILDFFE